MVQSQLTFGCSAVGRPLRATVRPLHSTHQALSVAAYRRGVAGDEGLTTQAWLRAASQPRGVGTFFLKWELTTS